MLPKTIPVRTTDGDLSNPALLRDQILWYMADQKESASFFRKGLHSFFSVVLFSIMRYNMLQTMENYVKQNSIF